MDDKHHTDETPTAGDGDPDPIAELGALDPADAPGPAERLAADLASELEDAGADAPPPVQLRADLEGGSKA